MLDLETLGQKPGCSILSIGAVPVDPEIGYVGGVEDGFYANIDRASCARCGLIEETDTLAWWSHPDRAPAWAALQGDTEELLPTLIAFRQYVEDCHAEFVRAWGATFDFPILEEAWSRLGLTKPWDHRIPSCARSFAKPFKLRPEHVRGDGEVHHHAQADCVVQARVLCKAYEMAGLRRG